MADSQRSRLLKSFTRFVMESTAARDATRQNLPRRHNLMQIFARVGEQNAASRLQRIMTIFLLTLIFMGLYMLFQGIKIMLSLDECEEKINPRLYESDPRCRLLDNCPDAILNFSTELIDPDTAMLEFVLAPHVDKKGTYLNIEMKTVLDEVSFVGSILDKICNGTNCHFAVTQENIMQPCLTVNFTINLIYADGSSSNSISNQVRMMEAVPGAPVNLEMEVLSTHLVVSCELPESNWSCITSYKTSCQPSHSHEVLRHYSPVEFGEKKTEWTIHEGIEPCSTYIITVAGVTRSGHYGDSAKSVQITTEEAVPGPVQDVKITLEEEQPFSAYIEWNVPTTGYQCVLHYAIVVLSDDKELSHDHTGNLNFVATSLKGGQLYQVKVAAVSPTHAVSPYTVKNFTTFDQPGHSSSRNRASGTPQNMNPNSVTPIFLLMSLLMMASIYLPELCKL